MRRIRAWLATTAKFGQMQVCDADLAERDLEGRGAEVGMPPGSRQEPHVRESFDVGFAQYRDELIEWPRAMTDGPDVHEDQCGRLEL